MRLSQLSVPVFAAVALFSFVASGPPASMAGTVFPAQDIEWENLQPDAPKSEPVVDHNQDPDQMTLRSLSDQWLSQTDPFDQSVPANEEEAIAELARAAKQETAPVVEAFNGKRVRLAGYIVPLDFESTKLKQFLLVPYVGACIHVPAPPTNQVVFIESEDAIEFTGLYDPVYVTGTMSTTSSKTELAEAGYRIQADDIRPYE